MFRATTSDGRVLALRSYPDSRLCQEAWNLGLYLSIRTLYDAICQNSAPLEARGPGWSLPLGLQQSNGNNGNVLPQYYTLLASY